ncbi:hypothetical protein NE237_019292 [Protea cynaroides]|uniref:Cysteine-rich transmembrane domain-containing protein n=1 Tax=Protea cynaroides TaxID=273540 RepID=A0A9Q0KBF3_9MAGN|nr:hypothetical protein NE237_019292 [Protea cynaroides]
MSLLRSRWRVIKLGREEKEDRIEPVNWMKERLRLWRLVNSLRKEGIGPERLVHMSWTLVRSLIFVMVEGVFYEVGDVSFYCYNMAQQSAVYPPPLESYPPAGQGYPQGPYVAPPPAGYPTKDGYGYGYGYPQQAAAPVETKSKGDGFWKGCCAALCCCCVLDMCT